MVAVLAVVYIYKTFSTQSVSQGRSHIFEIWGVQSGTQVLHYFRFTLRLLIPLYFAEKCDNT